MAAVFIVHEHNHDDGSSVVFTNAFRTMADAHAAIIADYRELFEEDGLEVDAFALPTVFGNGSSMWVDGITWYITAVTLP